MSLAAWRNGWQWCRPVIIVDGSFMKATFRGTLLTACALDGNRQIFPIGFGVCDRENNDTWKWFFTQLKQAIGDRKDLCVVSDRNEGIINAVKQVFPYADHGYCVQHILGNITTKFCGKKKRVIDLVNAAARASTSKLCEYLLGLLDAEDPRIRTYLEKIGKKNGRGLHLSAESTQS
ncbi:unnamed protein product [Cuscuta europaea]|uniref:MULE transposase domain-containing protein n=1 Tax=Cuscuta europaea TaxID=41803 RepID=A0A9P0ZK21_CUSEU|nr:unnamed protein product [Cuscuta europaea]